jgi:hypothetical protein
MRNFRSHKNRIISSKRDSQRLEQLELLEFSQLYSLGHINSRLGKALNIRLHNITHEHYKIHGQQQDSGREDGEVQNDVLRELEV